MATRWWSRVRGPMLRRGADAGVGAAFPADRHPGDRSGGASRRDRQPERARVKIPGVLVDCVVISQPEHHWQTFGTAYSSALSGELRRVRSSVPPMEMTERKVIARRAAMEL